MINSYGAGNNIPIARLEELLNAVGVTVNRSEAQQPRAPIQQRHIDMPPPQFPAQQPGMVFGQTGFGHNQWPGQAPLANPYDLGHQGHQPPFINAVNARVQPPPMDKDYIDLWFVRLESWFKNHQVKSDNQQLYILTTLLDSQLLAQVYDAAENPPNTGKYEHLKGAVQNALEDSKFKKYQKLLHGGDLGDQRPSHRLNELKRLANDGLNMNEGLLKHIWLSHLPSEAQAILAVSGDQNLSALAKLADNVVEGLSSRPHVAAVRHPEPMQTTESDLVRQLLKAIDGMSTELKAIRRDGRSRSKSRQERNTKSRSPSPSPTPGKKRYDTCWYHLKFGEEARNCLPDCKHYDTFSKN